MVQSRSKVTPIRVPSEIATDHIERIKIAGRFSSANQAVLALIEDCTEIYCRALESRHSVLAVAAPSAPAPAAVIAPTQSAPKPGTPQCFGGIDPSQLDDF